MLVIRVRWFVAVCCVLSVVVLIVLMADGYEVDTLPMRVDIAVLVVSLLVWGWTDGIIVRRKGATSSRVHLNGM